MVEPIVERERAHELKFAPTLIGRVRELGERGYPEEVCGGLLGSTDGNDSWIVRKLSAVENAAPGERARRYLIGPTDVDALERAAAGDGLSLIGFYHSHPDAPARPSDFDLEHAWPWYVYLIVSVSDGAVREVRAYRLCDDRSGFDEVALRDSKNT